MRKSANDILSPEGFLLAALQVCGSFSNRGSSRDLRSIGTVSKIAAVAEKAKWVRGVKMVRQNLRYILEGSASPRESMLAIHLILPYRRGGFGLPLPMLNHRIGLNEYEKSLVGKNELRLDLYWPSAKVAAEYDSDTWHLGRKVAAKDARRDDFLLYKGISKTKFTTDQFDNIVEFEKMVRILSKHLGKRISPRDEFFSDKVFELRKSLMMAQNEWQSDNHQPITPKALL